MHELFKEANYFETAEKIFLLYCKMSSTKRPNTSHTHNEQEKRVRIEREKRNDSVEGIYI